MTKAVLGREGLILAAVCAFVACSSQSVRAAAFGAGDLVVVQVGTGVGALSSSATAGFLDEFPAAGGAMVQSIALPTAVSGLNQPLTFSGSATSEGFLHLSADGQWLALAGYAAAPGVANPQT